MFKSVSIRVASALWLALGCGAVAADATVPPPLPQSTPADPPLPQVVQTVPITFETTAQIARQLHVGDFVRVMLVAHWPVRSSHTLIERCPVLSVGAVEADQPVEVELDVPLGVAERVVEYCAQYGSKLYPYLELVPLGADATDDASAAGYAFPRTTGRWAITINEARLTDPGWASLRNQWTVSAKQASESGDELLVLTAGELTQFVKALKDLNCQLHTRRISGSTAGTWLQSRLKGRALQKGGRPADGEPPSAIGEADALPQDSRHSPEQLSLSVRLWPGDYQSPLLEAVIEKFRASESQGALALGQAVKTLLPVTAVDALVIAVPRQESPNAPREWTLCAIQMERLPEDFGLAEAAWSTEASNTLPRTVAVDMLISMQSKQSIRSLSVDPPGRVEVVQHSAKAFEVIGKSPGRAVIRIEGVEGEDNLVTVVVLPAEATTDDPNEPTTLNAMGLSEHVWIKSGETARFMASERIKTFFVSAPQRLEYEQIDPRTFTLNGKQPGRTNIKLIDEQGRDAVTIVDVLPAEAAAEKPAPKATDPQPVIGAEHVIDASRKTVRLIAGERTVLRSTARIRSIDGFRPDLLSVKVESPMAVIVQATDHGTTTMRLTDEHDAVQTVVIEILSTGQVELSELIGRLYADAQVEVIQIKADMLLRGAVEDEETKQEIAEIASIYAPNVLNQIKVAPAAKTLQIPKGMRVLTISVDSAGTQWRLLRPGDRVDVMVTYSARDERGRQVTKTQTLLEYVELFSTDDRTARDDQPTANADRKVATVGLLLPPEHVPYVQLAQSKGKLSLAWRRRDDDELQSVGSINEELRDALRDLDRTPAAPAVPLYGSTPGLPVPPPPPTTPNAVPRSTAPSLQDDIRALHGDVKRLIELLEQRQRERAARDQRSESTTAAAPITLPVQGTHLLSFEAEWCGPCLNMRKPLAELADSHVIDGVVHINVDVQRQLAQKFSINAMPTFVLYKEGQEADRHVGLMSVAELRRFVGHPVEDSAKPIAELGVSVRELTSDEIMEHLRGELYRGGLWIDAVESGGLAERAGIRPGDVLVGLHVWETVRIKDVSYVFNHLRTPAIVPLKFYIRRGGATLYGHFSPPSQDDMPASLEVSPELPELQRPL